MLYNDIALIIDNGDQFVKLMRSDENGRYRSWEHCYTAFAKLKEKTLTDNDVDFLCLHLSFYLASWGMYRGSSFLLQKDYKVHATAIREIMKSEYIGLWAVKCDDYLYNKNCLNTLFSLSNALRQIYSDIRISANKSINRGEPMHPISDTLITKILMGTLGCVPAYDRYFNDGIKKSGVASVQFNSKSIENLSKYYVENLDDFENWRHSISDNGVEYSQMKVIDMCFWQIGYNLDRNKINRKNLWS